MADSTKEKLAAVVDAPDLAAALKAASAAADAREAAIETPDHAAAREAVAAAEAAGVDPVDLSLPSGLDAVPTGPLLLNGTINGKPIPPAFEAGEPEVVDPVDDIDVKVVATPDLNGYETIISITGAGRGRHVGSLRLIGPGGQAVILCDLDFNGPDWSSKFRSEFDAGFLRLPGSCEDDLEMVILPKPYDEAS